MSLSLIGLTSTLCLLIVGCLADNKSKLKIINFHEKHHHF